MDQSPDAPSDPITQGRSAESSQKRSNQSDQSTVSVNVVFADTFNVLSVPVSVSVYLPVGAEDELVVALELAEGPGVLPHPLTPRLNATRKKTAPSTGQRRRLNPGSPQNSSAASAPPASARTDHPPPLAFPEFLEAAITPLLPIAAHALFEVKMVTEPLALAVGFV